MLIKLDDEQKNELMKDVNGSGGFQSLMKKLQDNFDSTTNLLTVNNQELLNKIIQYAYAIFGRSIMLIKLDDEQQNELMKSVNGSGGFQSLMKKLQDNFDSTTNLLTVNQELLNKIIQYAYEYKKGGYQTRLKKILDLN